MNNEGADQTAPMRDSFAPLFFASNNIVFSRMQPHFLHVTVLPPMQILVFEALLVIVCMQTANPAYQNFMNWLI